MKQDFQNVLKAEGPRGIYKGALPTLFREVPGSGILFMVKDKIERKLKVQEETNYSIFLGKKILAGGFAGLSAW